MVEIWIGEKVEYRYRGKCTRTRRGEFTRTSSINFIGPLSITALVYSVDILNRLIWNDVKRLKSIYIIRERYYRSNNLTDD